MEIKGKDFVFKLFEAEGVKYVFGNPGSTEIPFLDQFSLYPGTKFVLALHESIAVSMADGYARASGKPGVACVHAAPGTAHSLGALYNANAGNVPVILLSGQQDARMLIREPLLSADLVSLTRPFTKWSWQVTRVEELPVALRRAFKEATSPPSGPVFLSLARNVLDETVDAEVVPPEKYRLAQHLRGDYDVIREAAELLAEAEAPVIFAGHGVSTSAAVPELGKLAETIGARIYAEPGAFPMDHVLYCGAIDLVNPLAQAGSGDLVLVVGTRMFAEFFYSPSCTLPAGTKAIHLDENARELAKNYPLDAAIVADPKTALREIVYHIQGNQDTADLDHIEQRAGPIAAAKREQDALLGKALEGINDGGFVRVARLARDLREVLDDDGIVVDDGTRSSEYLKKYFEFRRPGTYYNHAGGCLGWGIGAAMGVKLAKPDKQVVAFCGDGSAMYYPQALWTAAQENIAIVVVILNNRGYGVVRWLLTKYEGEALKQGKFTGSEITGIDYVRMAENFGVEGIRVQDETMLVPALKEALSTGRPMLVEVMLEP